MLRIVAIFAEMRLTLFLILLAYPSLHAQRAEVKNVDSLIRYHDYPAALRAIDSLYAASSTYIQLELSLQKAIIFEETEKNQQAIEVFHSIEENASNRGYLEILCRAYIKLALVYEKLGHFDLAEKYLQKAEQYIVQFPHLEPQILVRQAILLSENTQTYEDATLCANEALRLSTKYRDSQSGMDSKIVLGSIYRKRKLNAVSNQYYAALLKEMRSFNDLVGMQMVYHNIARNYLEMDSLSAAMVYSDSAYQGRGKVGTYYRSMIYKQRAELYYRVGNLDSTYAMQNRMHEAYVAHLNNVELNKVKELEASFESQKHAVVIRNQKLLLVLAFLSLGTVTFLWIKLLRRNRKISTQNSLIAGQRDDLQALVEQKSVLLKELQHRVKNNLQHVISILEIQKEAVNFSNMEELVRENQNRIHSMSLLYSRLNSSEDIQFIRLEEYFVNISHLVKESYGSLAKKVKLDLSCQMDKMEIAKVLPLGMILVELISNSIKHAFADKAEGKIFLHVWQEERNYVFHYMDNGKGYDFHDVREDALGMEIIKGLIQQLQGTVVNRNNAGFELRIVFQ